MSLSETLAKLVPQITYSFKAFPGHGQSLEVLAEQMRAAGNAVESINHEGGYVLCKQFVEKSDSWGCLLCLNEGHVILCDSEAELQGHLDYAHEGWAIDEEGLPVVY